MLFFFWFDTIHLGRYFVYIEGSLVMILNRGVTCYNFQNTTLFLSLKIVLSYIVDLDHDEMLHLTWIFTICQIACLGVTSIQRV